MIVAVGVMTAVGVTVGLGTKAPVDGSVGSVSPSFVAGAAATLAVVAVAGTEVMVGKGVKVACSFSARMGVSAGEVAGRETAVCSPNGTPARKKPSASSKQAKPYPINNRKRKSSR